MTHNNSNDINQEELLAVLSIREFIGGFLVFFIFLAIIGILITVAAQFISNTIILFIFGSCIFTSFYIILFM